MEEKKSILHYIGQVLLIYGFTIICMLCFAYLFGENAKEYSDFFLFGSQAILTKILAQFLLLSVLVVLEQVLFEQKFVSIFMGERIRSFLMILSVFITVIIFIVVFQWFPILMWQPWMMFFLCFLISAAGSIWITHRQNKKLSQGLSRL